MSALFFLPLHLFSLSPSFCFHLSLCCHLSFCFHISPVPFLTGIHTYTDSRSRPAGRKIRRGLWWPPTVSNHVNEESACVLVKQEMRLKKKPHARACWRAHPLAMTRMVVQSPNRASGRRQAKVTERLRSSQSCEDCQKSFIGTGAVAKCAH